MKRNSIVAVALLMAAFSANAQFVTVSEAYELRLSDVRVPATPSSGIIFRECGDCEMKTVRVTPQTLYIVNGRTVSLKDFRAAVFSVSDRTSTPVIVKHHLESDTVESVSVSI